MHVFFGLQTVLPAALLLWLAVRRPAGRFDWVTGVLAVFGVIAAVALVVPWLLVPAGARYIYLAAGLVAGVRSWFRLRPIAAGERRRGWRTLRRIVVLMLAVSAWTVAGVAVDGRRVPDGDVLDLACPLGSGTYLVVNGGSRQLVNAHLEALASDARFLSWRGQSYGVDLVQIDGLGRRAFGLMSQNPSDYLIYGELVTAPCDGEVVATVDDRPDMPVPMRDPDRSQPAGNHVMLACGNYEVLLAHLQPGSVRVVAGEFVGIGELLGFVGNSGDSDEPHLHLSAQRRGGNQERLGGDPTPITIGGVFPVRNDRVVCE